MPTAKEIQTSIDLLKTKIAGFETQSQALRGELAAKEQEIGTALLNGTDPAKIQQEIVKVKEKLESLEAVKKPGAVKLSETIESLKAVQRQEDLARVAAIRGELDQTAGVLEGALIQALKPCVRLEELLAKLRSIEARGNMHGLGPIWVHWVHPRRKTFKADVEGILRMVKEVKPK